MTSSACLRETMLPTDRSTARSPASPVPLDSMHRLHDLCREFDLLFADACTRQATIDLNELDRRSQSLIQSICAQIDIIAADCTLEEPLATFRRGIFQREVLKWVWLNPFMHTVWSKPGGCAGSHAAIRALCEDECELSTYTDVFFAQVLRCSMGRQHREKVRAQAEFMAERARSVSGEFARILNIGCGPSLDVQIALERLRTRNGVEFNLVDCDAEALLASQRRLACPAAGNVRITYDRADALRSVRRLVKRGGGKRFDAILFGGLFDYLQDRPIELILRLSKGLLNEGGELLFSQVAPDNPDRTYMDWFGDWRLHLRDEAQVRALA